MESKELSNICIAPMVVTPFSTQWSDDDHLSIITETGVHIFKLDPAPASVNPTFQFIRSFIHPPDTLPAAKFATDVNSLIFGLKREEVYSLLMDEAITPTLDNAKEMIPKVIGIAWSPRQLIQPNGCLLAILTSAGAVEILFESSKQWFTVSELSEVWTRSIYGKTPIQLEEEIKTGSFSKLTQHLRRLQATAVTWSRLYESDNAHFAYLVTAYRNSEIVIWRIPGMSCRNCQELKASIVFQKVIDELNCNLRINVIRWINLRRKVLIVIGYWNGQVDGILLDTTDGKFVLDSVSKYWNEADFISVSNVDIWENSDSGIQIIICKGFYLIAIEISCDGCVEDTQFIQIDGFSITGLVKSTNSNIIISTQNSGLFNVTFNKKQLTYQSFRNSLPKSRVQYLGLSMSPNGAMLVNVTSPSIIHDHLIIREPSTIYIFKLEGEEWSPRKMLQFNESKMLTRHWDCLESLRIQLLKSQDPSLILSTVPQELDDLSDYELRVVMWSLVIADTLDKKRYPRKTTSAALQMTDVWPLIMLRLVSSRLEKLSSRKMLSKEQHLSIKLLRSYIKVHLAGEEEDDVTVSIRRAKAALNMTSNLDCIEPESCDLCGETITVPSWKISNCPSGHKLPRCVMTFLQISTIKYRTCSICGQMFHPSLDAETDLLLCPFCDVPVLYDSRLVDPEYDPESKFKNRSIRRDKNSSVLLQSKNQEPDKLGGNEKDVSNSRKPTTVIIDNTADEHDSITETWEEL